MSRPQRSGFLASISDFIAELVRRRVLQMGGVYIAGAWLGAEVLNFLLEQFNAPDWTFRFLVIVFVVGFPLTMVLAWVVQVQDVDGSTVYTRAGNFSLNRDGALVLGSAAAGRLLLPNISIPQGAMDISISGEGNVE